MLMSMIGFRQSSPGTGRAADVFHTQSEVTHGGPDLRRSSVSNRCGQTRVVVGHDDRAPVPCHAV